MKFFEKIIIPFLIVFGLMIIIPYVLIRTSFGAYFISHLLSSHYAQTITIDEIEYSPFDIFSVRLNNVIIKDKNNNPHLEIKKVVLKLNPSSPYNFKKVKEIRLEDGSLTLNKINTLFSIQSQQLQLVNVDVLLDINNKYYLMRDITGGISPWRANRTIKNMDDVQFKFTSQQFDTPLGHFENLYSTGQIKDGLIYLNELGAEFNSAHLTAKIRQQNHDHWIVDHFQLSQLRYQTQQDIEITSSWQKMLADLPNITLLNGEITNSSIDSHNIKMTRFDAYIDNLSLEKGQFVAANKNSEAGFSAQDLVLGQSHFQKPTMRFSFKQDKPNTTFIDYASAFWNEGVIQAYGSIYKKTLHLDNLIMAKINYVLPENGLFSLSLLPSFFDQVNITQLTLAPSQITNINPAFPFQLSNAEIHGKQLKLTHDVPSQLAAGELIITAPHATINAITTTHFNTIINASPEKWTFKNISGLVNNKVVELTGSISQLPPFAINAELHSSGVSPAVFAQWQIQNISDLSSVVKLSGNIDHNRVALSASH